MAAGEVTEVVLRDAAGEESRYPVPWLAYLPLEAAVLEPEEGARISLRGWAGRLWVRLHGREGADGPLDLDGLRRAYAENRFAGLGTLGTESGIPVDPPAIALMDDAVHVRVPMPVLTLTEDGRGFGVTAAFPTRREEFGWLTYRADRIGDAIAHAGFLARRTGRPFHGGGDRLRALFPLQPFDDVFLAFSNALGRAAVRDDVPPSLRLRIERALVGRSGFENPAEAEDCLELCREAATALVRKGVDAASALGILEGVMARYELVDRAWMSERDRPPTFAP